MPLVTTRNNTLCGA